MVHMDLQLHERIEQVHSRSSVIDAHYDLLTDVAIQREYGRRKVIETDYLARFKKGGVKAVVCAIFVESSFLPEMGLRKALQQVSALHEEVEESPDELVIVKSAAELRRAEREGKIGFILSLEGAEPLYNDLSMLRIFYELGIRLIGLTWSRRNYAGDGSFFANVREGRKGGLTDFGVQLVEASESMGVIIDVSHLNDEGFWDVIQIAKKPVIASHSNCRSLVDSMRNLTDEQIKAIANKNGVIGLNASNLFTSSRDEDATLEQLLNHLDHMVHLVGPAHVGLGLDLCNDFMKYMSAEVLAKIPRKPFDVLPGHDSLPQITEILFKRGYKEFEIEQILGKNFVRVYDEVWK